jgi:predicted DsbA family dithiol-disulfide isomerase
MKVEIWSDVVCPFCYIGKRKFERALAEFPHREEVEIEWKSFQLAPELQPKPGQAASQSLAERKGWTPEQAAQAHERVTRIASEVGLAYRLDIAKVANTFAAHRVIQLAKGKGLGDAMEERLFRAYFSEGRDIADHATLIELAADAGLPARETGNMLAGEAFSDEVRKENLEGVQLGVTGVPFFVLNRRYGVSGAHESRVFLQALEQAFAEWKTAASLTA